MSAGEAYQEDITYEGLPHDALDELQLGDTRLGTPLTTTFHLRNHSNKHFKWVDVMKCGPRDSVAALMC